MIHPTEKSIRRNEKEVPC